MDDSSVMNKHRHDTTLSFMAALRFLSLALVAMVVASCGPTGSEGSAASPAPSTASLTPSPVTTAMPAVGARLIAGVGGRARVSPDGKWIAVTPPQPGGKGNPPWSPTIELYDIDGKLVRSVEVPTPNWRWMQDSSGLFVALDAPQRPPSLGVLDIAGTAPRAIDMSMVNQQLSRDGKWILGEQAEGCCTQVTYPEIRIAPRAGGDVKTLVTAVRPSSTVQIVGIDASDRLVYRDGSRVLRVPIAGGAAQLLGTLPQPYFQAGNSSPDGTAILMRAYEPSGWFVVGNDRVARWPDSSGEIVEDRQGPRLISYPNALWIGAHALLVRAPTGDLSSVDALTGLPTALNASIDAADVPLAHDRGRLLVTRGKSAIVIDLASGRQADIGLALVGDLEGALASALPSGGFVLSTSTATYRID
jgi:hypothetical protein